MVIRRDAVRARRAELDRRERERRQWILDEQARIARERAASRPASEPRITVKPPQSGRTVETPPIADTKRPATPTRPKPGTIANGLAGGTLGNPSLGADAPPLGINRPPLTKPRPIEDPYVPADPPTYVEPIDYVDPVESAAIVIVDDYDVACWAPDVDLVCHDSWASHHGWHSWIHPSHFGHFHPVYHGWDHGWSWNLSFGFSGSNWWFGLGFGNDCFPYVPYVAARRYPGFSSHYGWWRGSHRYWSHGFHGGYARNWYRPHIAWYADVCSPRTETVYITVEREIAPPPPSLSEAWDAFAIGRIGRAADLFGLILDARPGDDAARLGLGLARARLGDITLAASDIRQALDLGTDVIETIPFDQEVVAELGVARSRLRDRLRVDANDLDALLLLAVVLDGLNDPAAAYHAVDRAIDLGEVSAAAIGLRGELDRRLLIP